MNTEPVRMALYPLVALIVGFLVVKGVLSSDDADFILGLAVLILGALGIEVARSKVTPWNPDE